ncbi:MAG: PKD domain-containing protein, partial [Cyclobacteriaceae bacterium]|nr:PKD domain-containing protein [Cyclobacteriaceae bacterium]
MAHQTPSPPHDGHPLYLRVITGFIFAVLLGIGPVAHSQLITETQWFFGNSKANLQFDKNGDRVYGETRMVGSFGMGGPAVISDQYTGNLLFYCDGQAIYDASHRVVPGGSGLAGNPSINQSAVACPLPASGTQYFIFTNSGSTGVNEIRYTTVDASRAGNGSGNAPLGEALVSNSATGLTDPAEAMIIVESQVPQLYWLISQNRTTFDFRVTRITPAGIGTTQVFNLDTTTTLPGAVASQFAYNKDSMLLAVAPRTANRNILLLDFNDTLGTLSVRKSILRTGYNDGAGESVYDLEWSGDGSKLYFSRFGGVSPNTGQVYQVDLLDSLAAVNRVMSAPVYRSLGLKRGIDDRIYHLFQAVDGGPYQLGRFDQVDSVAGVVTYQAPFLTTDFNGRQFPQFAPPDFQASQFTMDFYYLDSCQNDATKFFARIDPAPNTIYWTFGDGSSSSAVAPIHTYGGPGAYFVNLHAELNGRVGIYSQLVEVFANDLLVNLGSDTVICVNETLTLDAGAGGTSYQWSTGETTQTIVVDTAGTYWVEMTGPTGCTAFDAIEVTEYGISQQLANQWYFGEMAGLDFNIQPDGTPPPVALADNNKMFSPEGCATISDTDGHLLFYTNGVTVWNRDHDVMPIYDPSSTSPFLGGNNTASQGVLILPFMGDETMFYIFTAEEVYGDLAYDLRYSIVDMKKDSADGAIVVKDVPLFQKSTEKITASGFSVSAWLISHEFGNNNFRSNLVTDNGIGSTIHTPVG